MKAAAADAHVAPPALSLRYHVWLYSPPELREFTAATFAIEREIAASIRPGIDHAVAHARLEWWEGECERIAAGRPVHPLGQALQRAWSALPAAATAPRPDLGALVVNARWDLAAGTFESRAELDAYCTRWAHCVPAVLAVAAGTDLTQGPGAALRELELLENIAPDAAIGRLRLPLGELVQRGIEPDALVRPPWAPPLAALLGERFDLLHQALQERMQALGPPQRRSLRALVVWTSLAARRALQGRRALPAPRPARRRDRVAEALLAWRAARRALVGPSA